MGARVGGGGGGGGGGASLPLKEMLLPLSKKLSDLIGMCFSVKGNKVVYKHDA